MRLTIAMTASSSAANVRGPRRSAGTVAPPGSYEPPAWHDAGVLVLWVLLVVAVAAAVVAVAAGRGGGLADVPRDLRPLGLPDGPLRAEDVAALRFHVVVRGYRMDEVDAVIDRLCAELAQRDGRIAELEAEGGGRAWQP